MKEALGQRIRRLRESRDLGVRELARMCGFPDGTWLSAVELGKRGKRPNADKLAKVAEVLKVSLDELMGEDNISRSGGIMLDDDPRLDHRDALIAIVRERRDKREIDALLKIRRLREGEGETMGWWRERLNEIHETLTAEDAEEKALAERSKAVFATPMETTKRAEAIKAERAKKTEPPGGAPKKK